MPFVQAESVDAGPKNQLLEAVYPELHRLASAFMRRERSNHTLQPTALVNEAYMRLASVQPMSWESRLHFVNAAAQVMRRILIDHARSQQARKRAGGQRVELDETSSISVDNPDLLLSIDRALCRLANLDERLAKVVELRYFGGLSVDETAQVMQTSLRTVKRDWALARAWLENELRSAGSRSHVNS